MSDEEKPFNPKATIQVGAGDVEVIDDPPESTANVSRREPPPLPMSQRPPVDARAPVCGSAGRGARRQGQARLRRRRRADARRRGGRRLVLRERPAGAAARRERGARPVGRVDAERDAAAGRHALTAGAAGVADANTRRRRVERRRARAVDATRSLALRPRARRTRGSRWAVGDPSARFEGIASDPNWRSKSVKFAANSRVRPRYGSRSRGRHEPSPPRRVPRPADAVRRDRLRRVRGRRLRRSTNLQTDDLGGRQGVDYSWARPSPAGLHADGYTFAARYVSGGGGKDISAGEAQSLIGAGLDVVLVWEQEADAVLGGYGRGVADAQAAATEAAGAGQPGDRPIYFASVDFDAQASQEPNWSTRTSTASSYRHRPRSHGRVRRLLPHLAPLRRRPHHVGLAGVRLVVRQLGPARAGPPGRAERHPRRPVRSRRRHDRRLRPVGQRRARRPADGRAARAFGLRHDRARPGPRRGPELPVVRRPLLARDAGRRQPRRLPRRPGALVDGQFRAAPTATPRSCRATATSSSTARTRTRSGRAARTATTGRGS